MKVKSKIKSYQLLEEIMRECFDVTNEQTFVK